ncbi:MAG TPA: vWA domain-containing protein [Acidimicrobiales bacterium]|nr:vWA domain-containing protein [Acidimicrobiales bacterium]
MSFSVEVFQNENLYESATKVHAIVRVTSSGGRSLATAAEKIVVLVVDTSGSMEMPNTKIRYARQSAAAALKLLPDGTRFALVAGTDKARCVYPRSGEGLASADERTRAEAAELTARLVADGGTAISTWIDLVRELVEPYPRAIRVAYLLTDGVNQGESSEALDASLHRAANVFQCDTRGVGEDWSALELRKIASALLGEVDRIAEPHLMEKDFRAFMDRAIGKTIADVRLRAWIPKDSKVAFFSQVAPTIDDLTDKGEPGPPQAWDYPTGAWAGHEVRDYHLCIDTPSCPVGEEKLAARLGLVVGDDVAAKGLVRAVWTDDVECSTRINREVAHYTDQEELSKCVDEGLDALDRGDEGTATVRLRRAVDLAQTGGRDDVLHGLLRLVDMDGPTVRLKAGAPPGAANAPLIDTLRTRPITRRPPEEDTP